MIESIDTFYNGNYFRSRLEARWAVYFDLVGIEYQYEPAGFEFRGKYDYLPDFYLPKFEIYCEIKNRNAFSVDRNSQKLESGTENAFRYQKIAEEMHKEGILWAMFIGSPYEIFHESPWWCFQEDWSFYGAEIDSILEEHILPDSYKWAGESSAKCRFEHGFDPDEFVKREKRQKNSIIRVSKPLNGRYAINPKRARIEETVLGMLSLYPEYSLIEIGGKTIHEYTFLDKNFNSIVFYIWGQANHNKECPDDARDPEEILRVNLDTNTYSEKDLDELNKYKKERLDLSFNDEKTYKLYLEALFTEEEKDNEEIERRTVYELLMERKLKAAAIEAQEASI